MQERSSNNDDPDEGPSLSGVCEGNFSKEALIPKSNSDTDVRRSSVSSPSDVHGNKRTSLMDLSLDVEYLETNISGEEDFDGELSWDDDESDDSSFCDYDDMLFCDQCLTEWEGNCPKHGPLLPVKDIKVTAEDDKHRAKKTAPQVITVADAGNGVWAREPIPVRTRFGPFQGRIIPPDAPRNAYTWPILRNGEVRHYVDAQEPSLANWMRYVCRAQSYGEQNLNAFQAYGKIYYRTIRPIAQHEELLVWYSDQLGRQPKKMVAKPSQDMWNGKAEAEEHKGEEKNGRVLRPRSTAQRASWNNQPEKAFRCNLCGKQFDLSIALRVHERTHNKDRQTVQGKHDQPRVVKCEKCNKLISPRGNVEAHRRTHVTTEVSSNNPLKCNVCQKMFIYKTSLIYHLRMHTGEKPFACSVCQSQFSQRSNLYSHFRVHHSSRAFQCKHCDKKYSRKDHLTVHLKKHKNEEMPESSRLEQPSPESAVSPPKKPPKPFAWRNRFGCQMCKMRFSQRNHLTTHLFLHKEEGEKALFCAPCNRRFKQLTMFEQHLAYHQSRPDLVCTLCGKYLDRKSDLEEHMRVHTGERPFKCAECNKRFASRSGLRKHKRMHSKWRPQKSLVLSMHQQLSETASSRDQAPVA